MVNLHPTAPSLDTLLPDRCSSQDSTPSLIQGILSIFDRLSFNDLNSAACVNRTWNACAVDRTIKVRTDGVAQFIKTLVKQMDKLMLFQQTQEMEKLVGYPLPHVSLLELKTSLLTLKESILSILQNLNPLEIKILDHHMPNASVVSEFKDLFEWAELRCRLVNVKKILLQDKITEFNETLDNLLKNRSNQLEIKETIDKLEQTVEQIFPTLEAQAKAFLILDQPSKALAIALENENKIPNFKELLLQSCFELAYREDTAGTEGMNIDQAIFIAKKLEVYQFDHHAYSTIFEVLGERGDHKTILNLKRTYFSTRTDLDAFVLKYHVVKNIADYHICLCYLAKNAQGEILNLEVAMKYALELNFSHCKNHVYSLIIDAFLSIDNLDDALASLDQLEHEPSTLDLVIETYRKVHEVVVNKEKLAPSSKEFKMLLRELKKKIEYFTSKKELILNK